MVVADIEFVQGLHQGTDDLGISVTQVKDSAVTMAVNHPPFASDIPQVGPFPSAEHKIYAYGLEEPHLARGNVSGKDLHDHLFAMGTHMLEVCRLHLALLHMSVPRKPSGLPAECCYSIHRRERRVGRAFLHVCQLRLNHTVA